jgi:hypothetical protein
MSTGGCSSTYGGAVNINKQLTPAGATTPIDATASNIASIQVPYPAIKDKGVDYKVATVSFTASNDCASKCSTVNIWVRPCASNDEVTNRRLMM